MNILHITDLHISEPITSESTTKYEGLRDSYYEEYLEGLLSSIDINIDFLVVTGDLVDRSKFKNYPHVSKIIKHISSKLEIPTSNIFITNGNHDVPQTNGDLSEFKKLIDEFEKEKRVICQGKRYTIYSCSVSNTGFLCLDSIGDNYRTGKPSNLTQFEEDQIVSSVKEQKFSELFVLSHHPAASYELQNQAPFDEDDDDWSKKHIWNSGGNLFRRLSSTTNVSNSVYWFAGDVHRPEFTIIDQKMFLIVGSSCNSVAGETQGLPPTVTVLSLENPDNKYQKSYNKNTEGHFNRSLSGEWISKIVEPKYFGTKEIEESTDIEKSIVETKVASKNKEVEDFPKVNDSFTLIDRNLENQLLNSVIDRELYHFGRFGNRTDSVSLGWVSISNMLNESSLYLKVINGLKTKIESIISSTSNIQKKDCILLGIDHWGSILSARLGAALNIRSCCVATDQDNRDYDTREILNNELEEVFSRKKIIFCISDVVSTGHTIREVSHSNLYRKEATWYNLCILFDPIQSRSIQVFENFSHTYFLCGSIKIPIIKSKFLPDTPLLQPQSHILR